MVRQWQELFHGEKYSSTDLSSSNPDFVKIAEAIGVTSFATDNPDEVDNLLKGNVTVDGSVLENAKVYIINQDTAANATTNSTGGWTYQVMPGTYLIAIYDPNNTTRPGGIHPNITIT